MLVKMWSGYVKVRVTRSWPLHIWYLCAVCTAARVSGCLPTQIGECFLWLKCKVCSSYSLARFQEKGWGQRSVSWSMSNVFMIFMYQCMLCKGRSEYRYVMFHACFKFWQNHLRAGCKKNRCACFLCTFGQHVFWHSVKQLSSRRR